ncbi:MAG TPA: Rv3654c family TadE-like protein [Lapillicoccus sp.]
MTVSTWMLGVRPRRRVRDRGSGTVAAVGVAGVLLAMTVGALLVVSAVVAAHRAQAAADLGALAAAAAMARGESSSAACARGATVAARNGAVLASCRAATDLSVEVLVEVRATAPRVGSAAARSRAGPSTSGTRRASPHTDDGTIDVGFAQTEVGRGGLVASGSDSGTVGRPRPDS